MKQIYHYFNQIVADDVWLHKKGLVGWYTKVTVSNKGTNEDHYYYTRDDNNEPLNITPTMVYKEEWTLGDNDYIQMY